MRRQRIYHARSLTSPLPTRPPYSPSSPQQMDWHFHFPNRIPPGRAGKQPGVPQVEFADVGCGFGGLLFYLAPLFPDTLMVGA